jgi:vacuolar-type H+-ATPase subunit F/Vma7
MAAFAYVGNVVDAAAYRLIGAYCWAPDAGKEVVALRNALKSAEAVFITAAIAERLPRTELDAALASGHPPVVIIPELDRTCPLDPAERTRTQLGLDR